ncbi:MAG TPA: hypothetical protein DD670_10380, partial [Planctomycetaceae bacterium]|nr:hypothetical protein [Planctomycetaceae bacterium]
MEKALTATMIAMLALALVFNNLTMVNSATAEDEIELREEQAFQAAVDQVSPSIVRIETVGGRERIGDTLLGTGPTTGLIVGEDGLIVSSQFNFLRRPDSILVQLSDGRRKPARLLATDHGRMVVLLKIEVDEPLPVPEFAARETMRVGQWTIAVGRTFEVDRPNMSVGILSAASRIRGRAIQTDAATSPNNYGGPLVDILGRVLGVLTPLSADPNEEVGRLEWYDAGIGFAVPAEDILRVLPRLRAGEDLYPGLLGVAFAGPDPNTAEPIIAACHPKSPGYGVLLPGDRIASVDDRPVARVAELEEALGRRYAGDKVGVTILREGKTSRHELTLAAELPSYERAFLGILPRRDGPAAEGPVAVRFVYPDSPASRAGIAPGDLLAAMAGKELAGADDLRRRVALLVPEDEVTLDVRRDGETRSVSLALGRMPEALPDDVLPPARDTRPVGAAKPSEHAKVAISVPDIENEAWVYLPKGHDPAIAHGVVVWLDAPGAVDDDAILRLWRSACDQGGLVLLTVKPSKAEAWLPDEEAVVARL